MWPGNHRKRALSTTLKLCLNLEVIFKNESGSFKVKMLRIFYAGKKIIQLNLSPVPDHREEKQSL